MRGVLAAALLAALATGQPANRLTGQPDVIPWAWERRENLRFLGEGHTVAWYAGLITLTNDGVVVAPRRNPLFVPKNTHRIAVVRIETSEARSAWSGARVSRAFERRAGGAHHSTGVTSSR